MKTARLTTEDRVKAVFNDKAFMEKMNKATDILFEYDKKKKDL